MPDRRVFAVAGLVFALLMALSPRYGFHIDELYFLDCARHLQPGHVGRPVLAPLLARLSLSLFGVSESGLRLWPALAAAGTVVVGGMTAGAIPDPVRMPGKRLTVPHASVPRGLAPAAWQMPPKLSGSPVRKTTTSSVRDSFPAPDCFEVTTRRCTAAGWGSRW